MKIILFTSRQWPTIPMLRKTYFTRVAFGLSILSICPVSNAASSNRQSVGTRPPPSPEAAEHLRVFRLEHKDEIEAADRRLRLELTDLYLKKFAENGENDVGLLLSMNLPFEEGYPIISRFLEHPKPKIVAQAIYWLGKSYGKRGVIALPRIIEAYVNDKDYVAYEAAQIFPIFGEDAKSAISPMIRKLQTQTGSKRMRLMTIVALGEFGPAAVEAISLLELEQTSKDSEISYEAYRAIGKIRQRAWVIDPAKLNDPQVISAALRDDAYSVLNAIRRQLVPKEIALEILQRALQHEDYSASVQIMATESLGLLAPSDSASIRLILEKIASTNPTLSQIAQKAAERFLVTDSPAIEVLGLALESRDERVVIAAADLLFPLGERAAEVVPHLIRSFEAIDMRTETERIAAVLDLARAIGPKAKGVAPILVKYLQEDAVVYNSRSHMAAEEIRIFTLLTMARIGITVEAVPAIVDLLSNSADSKSFAFAAIAAAALPEGPERSSLAKYLTKVLDKEYIDLAASTRRFGEMVTNDEPEVNTSARIAAIRALVAIGGAEAKKAIPLLQERATDPFQWLLYGLNVSYQAEAAKAIELLSK